MTEQGERPMKASLVPQPSASAASSAEPDNTSGAYDTAGDRVTITVPDPAWVEPVVQFAREASGVQPSDTGTSEVVGPRRRVTVAAWDLRAPTDLSPYAVSPPQFAASPRRLQQVSQTSSVRWVWGLTAGYENLAQNLRSDLGLTNGRGVHEESTADLALGLAMASVRRIDTARDAQNEARWDVRWDADSRASMRSLHESRVLIVGYGGIGRAVARRMLACGAQVTAVASRARTGDELVDQVHGTQDLDELLPQHHVVVIVVPLSDATHGLFSAPQLAAMADGSLVVNVSRGPVLDTQALMTECASGRLRAALDVTDPEPLPDGHPLFTTPGVLLTPHVGGATAEVDLREQHLIARQVRHLAHGEEPINLIRPVGGWT